MENGDLATTADHPPASPVAAPPTPLSWRLALAAAVLLLGLTAWFIAPIAGPRGQAACGVGSFLLLAFLFSANVRAVNWQTIGWGVALQLALVLFIRIEIFGVRPGYEFFNGAAAVAKQFLAFSDAGASFVFGSLTNSEGMKILGGGGYVFAFRALPTIIFVSSFFTVLYYLGILQVVVWALARVMRYLMRTSGAETLSVTANVVMGQTEAPLMVKPYVAGMTQSELLAMMVGGMAHISGALMAVYIGMGADPVAILATSVMASPCSLYLAKIIRPETGKPQTSSDVKPAPLEKEHANVIDAAAAGASDGVRLALNIAGMLIAFLAFIALFDFVLKEGVSRGLQACFGVNVDLSLSRIFSWLFAPAAYLIGVQDGDIFKVADLLGVKLVANEFVAYTQFQKYSLEMSERSKVLATYALTGFANFASIGIQLGGIGALAPSRRSDLARLGGWALFTGFLATLINAAIAGVLL
jgi:CNT family concentrative nucleoside transporter